MGDTTVASSTGAFEYSYPIAVPPGRLGAQPSLALRYSSQGALRGGIAAGWSLSIPEIKLEFPEGRVNGGVYVSSMSGGHRLVRTMESVASVVPGLDAAYRAEYDDSYIRYSIDEDGDSYAKAVAMTLDGMVYRFGEKNRMGMLLDVDSSRWPLTSTVDKFGNVVVYEYDAIPSPLEGLAQAEEFVLSRIKYGMNDSAGLGHHASINFVYRTSPPCAGTTLAAGASLNHRWTHLRTRGAKKLSRIITFVKDSPDGSSRPVRTIELGYDLEAERCDAGHGPLRMLNSVTEHAPVSAGDPNPGQWSSDNTNWISKPPVTFRYGPLARAWDVTIPTEITSLGNGSRSFSEAGLSELHGVLPTLDQMLLDINGDGIVDKINSVQPSATNEFKCQMSVRLGDGTGYSAPHSYDLPMLPWQNEGVLTGDEGCSLSGQHSFQETRQLSELCGNIGSYLAYRFIDMNADGLPDLVTEISSDPLYFMAWDPDSGVDDTDLPPYDPDIPGAIPMVSSEQLVIAESGGGRDCSRFDQEAVKDLLATSEGGVPGYLYRSIHPHHRPKPTVEDYLVTGLTPPVPGTEPDCMYVRTRIPQVHNGRFVWRWYENVGGVFSTQRRLTMSPIPLTANAGESGFGNGPLSNSTSHGVYDINGDGFVDAISRDANPDLRDEQGRELLDPKFNPLVWWVWPGDGDGGFDTVNPPIAWKIPALTNLSHGFGDKFPGGTITGQPDYFVGGDTTVRDVNGDGLVDLLKVMVGGIPTEKKVYVFLNTGEGFRSAPFTGYNDFTYPPPVPAAHIAWPYLAAGLDGEVDSTSFGVIDDLNDNPGYTPFLPRAARYSRLMIADVDGDGIPDVSTKGTERAEASHRMHFGAADGRLLGAIRAHKDVPRRQLNGVNTIWKLVSDYIDMNGDGVMDQVIASPTTSTGNAISGTYLTDDFQGQPMRLMVEVDNGNGLTTKIRYAPNNSTEVAVAPVNIRGMPNHVWVVKSVQRSENFGPDVVASPDNIVQVRYGAPVWNEDKHGHWGFRGFETFEISAPHEVGAISGFRVTERKFDFDLDWSGRPKEIVQYVDGFPQGDGSDAVASISKTYWKELAVTGGLSLSYVQTRQATRASASVNGAFQSESECAASPLTNETLHWHRYYRDHEDTTGPYLLSREWRTWEAPTGYFSSFTKDGAIMDQSIERLFSDGTQYHLMPISETRYRANGTTIEVVAKTERQPDPSGRYFTEVRTYVGNDSQTTLRTYFQRDVSTGHLISRQKPEQHPLDLKEVYEYTGFQVVPSRITNELLQSLTTETDLGTGQTIVTETPNTITCANGFGPAGTETSYDGFGRPVELFEYGCDINDTYAPIRLKRFEYKDYDGTNPTSVLTHSLIAYSGAEAESESYFDGYGRLIRTRALGDNGNATSLYEYGVNGQIRRYKTPNPAKNSDVDKSEFAYRYDSLGRQVGMRVANDLGIAPDPDSDAVTWDSSIGVDVTYASVGSELITTRTEHVLDGSAISAMTTYHNNFGQLTRVDEGLGDDAGVATTLYEFDGNGNLCSIQDADNLETSMEHDWASRRTRIVRGARQWKFAYDLNSNLVLETAPLHAGAIEADYQTSYFYDALDRILRVHSAPRDLTDAEQGTFGADIPTIYSYDIGPNAVGLLSSVGGPFYKRSYTYDFAGRVASEQFAYDVSSGTGISGQVAQSGNRTFHYNAVGAPTSILTADGMQLGYEYDSAGRQKKLLWENSGLGNVNVAEFTRNVAGNVILQCSGSVVRDWEYDHLGRVAETTIRNNANNDCATSGGEVKMSESMSYFDSNEVETLEVVRLGLESRTFNFGYDSQHQLVSAADTIDEYIASFAYTGAGRVKGAFIANVDGAPLVIGRDVGYQHGNHVNLDGHAVEALTNSDGSPHTVYGYDLSGNVTKRHEDAANLTWHFRYDGNDQQRSVTGPSGNDELYYYDENGQRFLSVERNKNGEVTRSRFWFGDSEFWFDGDGQVEQKMTNLTLGATAIARVDNENDQKDLEYSFHNGLGHLMGAVDINGDLTTAYVYGPFGEIIEQSGETDTHLRRFNGKEADQLSGLNYYGFRYYDPLSLTWTQSDPLFRVAPDLAYDQPRLMSLYTFSLNNPVRYLDPDGRIVGAIVPPLVVIGGVFVDLVTTVSTAIVVGGTAGAIAHPIEDGFDTAFDQGYISPGAFGAQPSFYTPPAPVRTLSIPETPTLNSSPKRISHLSVKPNEAPISQKTGDSDTPDEDGTIYEVPGTATSSGKPYIGRHKGPNPKKNRRSNDGRDRKKAKIVDRYDPNKPREGRKKEQQAIDARGGVDKLDNVRNEIAPKKRGKYGLDN